MTTQQQLRQAILDGDYSLAESLLRDLPRTPKSLQEAGEVKQLLVWALQMMRINRAHDAARLADQIRASAYNSRRSETSPTWELDA
jgi:hypothetical protein